MIKPPAFIYSEARVADELGLSRSEARRYRLDLKEGLDWKKERGEIVLSQIGLERLTKRCGAPLTGDLIESLQKKNGGPVKMRVMQIPPNPRMVLAAKNGAQHLVYVGSNSTFVFGDEIEVGPHKTQKGIWQLLSPIPRDRRRFPR